MRTTAHAVERSIGLLSAEAGLRHRRPAGAAG